MRSNSRKQIEEVAMIYGWTRLFQHMTSDMARITQRLHERKALGNHYPQRKYERRIEHIESSARPRRKITGRNHR